MVSPHLICEGRGILKDEYCICLKIFKLLKEFYKSNIPNIFWEIDSSKLKYEKEVIISIKSYFENYEQIFSKGLGLYIFGEFCTGKTTLLIEIAKKNIVKGKKVFYLNLKEYFDEIFNEEEKSKQFIERFKNADLLILDEFHKTYQKSGSDWITNNLNNLLRIFINRGKPVLIGSNVELSKIDLVYSKAIKSILNRFNKEIVLKRKFEEILKNNWEERLVEKTDYLSNKSLIRYSEEYYKGIFND